MNSAFDSSRFALVFLRIAPPGVICPERRRSGTWAARSGAGIYWKRESIPGYDNGRDRLGGCGSKRRAGSFFSKSVLEPDVAVRASVAKNIRHRRRHVCHARIGNWPIPHELRQHRGQRHPCHLRCSAPSSRRCAARRSERGLPGCV